MLFETIATLAAIYCGKGIAAEVRKIFKKNDKMFVSHSIPKSSKGLTNTPKEKKLNGLENE